MTGRLRVFVPLGVIAALALIGCSGTNDEASPTLAPVTSPPTATSAPATTTAPPAQVVRAGPPPKTPFTKKGAELFVRDYYATVNAALRTGADSSMLKRYLSPSCDCDNLVEVLNQARRKHRHFVGNGFLISRVRVPQLLGAAAVTRVTFSLDKMRVVDAAGRTVDHSNEVSRQTNSMVLIHEHGGWVVEKILLGNPS